MARTIMPLPTINSIRLRMPYGRLFWQNGSALGASCRLVWIVDGSLIANQARHNVFPDL